MKRKIIIWTFTFVMLIACATTSTYAWFQLNQDGWVTEFEFGIDTDESIEISVDGTNYYETITDSDLMKAIVKEAVGGEYDRYGKLQGYSSGNIKDIFNSIAFNPITSLDGINFSDYYGNQKLSKSKEFYSFEIYIKLSGNNTGIKEVPIYFVNTNKTGTFSTSIQSEAVDYVYRNNFTTYDKETFEAINYSPNKVLNESSQLINPTISVNAKDAIRFSTEAKFTKVENKDIVKIYEPHLGLGSYATDYDSKTGDASLSKYDANKNAGFTLLNASLATPLVPMKYVDMPGCIEGYGDEVFCMLYKEEGYVTKVKFNIWLEGYDADCFNGIGRTKVKVNFAFGTEKGGNVA